MKISKLLIILSLFFGCSNNQVKSEYDIFLNDYKNNTSYQYIINNDKLIKNNKYNGIIEDVKTNKDSFYLRINDNYNSHLKRIINKSSNIINLNNETPSVFYPYQDKIYYSSNYVKNNTVKSIDENNKTNSYSLKDYYVDHMIIEDEKIYLFIENQYSNKQQIQIMSLDFKVIKKIDLKDNINMNNVPIINKKEIYYICKNNNLISIDKKYNLKKLLQLKEKHANKLLKIDNKIYISHYDIFDQKHNSLITIFDLKTKKIDKQHFDLDIIDIVYKNDKLLVLFPQKLNIYDKNFKSLDEIKLNKKLNAIKVQ